MRITPARVVAALEATFPWAARGTPTPNLAVNIGSAPAIGMIVALAKGVSPELLPSDPDDYASLIAAIAALEMQLTMWAGMSPGRLGGGESLHGLVALRGWSPIAVICDVFSRCPEEAVESEETGLEFVGDGLLRASLRLDLSRARRALERGDFKSTTVLGGAVIEALLLDAVGSLSDPEVATAFAAWAAADKRASDPRISKSPHRSRDRWSLYELVWIANAAGIISGGAAAAADVARDFRNLIHPGKLRTSAPADEGTAFAALGAALRVASELEARSK